MPVRLVDPRERERAVAPVRIDPLGQSGPTRRQAGGSRWRRSSHGLYVPADVDPDAPEQRVVEAAVRLRGHGGLTGWAALRWAGAVWFDGRRPGSGESLPVVLALAAHDLRDQPGMSVCHEGLPPDHVVSTHGLSTTVAARSVAFEARYASSLVEAVVAIDMAAYSDLCSNQEVADFVSTLGTWTGVPQARRAVALATENSWSPMETRLRMTWLLDAGLPTPRCNTPVFDLDGNHLGTPDLLDPTCGLAVEYDGRFHLEGAQRRRDAEREERLRAAGLECTTVLGTDFGSTVTVARRLVGARERAVRTLAVRARRWTLRPPAWWTATDTVARRRALHRQLHRDRGA